MLAEEVIRHFRVSQTTGRSRTIINIDGQLLGDYVRLAEEYCSKAFSSGKPLCVYLRNVSAIDQAGREFLSRLAARGIRLLASGVYTSHVVKTLKR